MVRVFWPARHSSGHTIVPTGSIDSDAARQTADTHSLLCYAEQTLEHSPKHYVSPCKVRLNPMHVLLRCLINVMAPDSQSVYSELVMSQKGQLY